MKRLLASVVVGGLALTALSTVSFAGPNANAKIQLHLATTTTKQQCTRAAAHPPCTGIVTNGLLYPQLYYAYVLVTDADAGVGIAGCQFGIQYDGPGPLDGVGVDIDSWALCATLEFQQPSPVWPTSGGGNLITWNAVTVCQRNEPGGPGTGVVATAGWFACSAYTPACFRITPRPADGLAKVADCAAAEDNVEGVATPRNPSHLGFVCFSASGTTGGYNPCGLITPVERTTWGALKSTYNR
jgi:hypothetical protein